MDREAERFEDKRPTMREVDEFRKREADRAGGVGVTQGAQAMDTLATRVIDKRICQNVLFQRAGELERQSIGIRRLAELVGATSDNDYPLFVALLAMTSPR